MKKIKYMSLMMALATVLSLCFTACSSDDEKDMTPPVISGQGIAVASPINCEVYHPGDVIPVRYMLTDDMALGSFNIEVHDNFDHHTHSTEGDNHEGTECEDHDGEHHHDGKEEGTTWKYNESFKIDGGVTAYPINVDITVPKDARHGDYHFMIKVTDLAGWQQLKALAIKIE